jgi:hypothetical protein
MLGEEPKIKVVDQPFAGSVLVVPNDGQPHPGIVFLHGSEGGGYNTWKMNAFRWAAEGYATLSYCYFGANDGLAGPRQPLADIEVGDVIQAVQWLKSSEFVRGRKMALDGTSRGGELALLTGSLLEDSPYPLAALAVHSPSDQIWGPWNFDWIDSRCWLSDVPKVNEVHQASERFRWNPRCGPDPARLPENLKYAWKWKGQPLREGARIEVERIGCPVFMTQGLSDNVWPAEQAKAIERTFSAHGCAHEAVFYENEGHRLSNEANFDRQKRLLKFYRKYLGV